jgi:serine/threonine-protein kinase
MNPEDRFQSIAEFRAALLPPPAPPPQVRVSQKTTTLPPQPQVAPPAAAPARSPAPAQPAAVQARPAAPAVPIAAPAPQAQQAQPRRRGGFVRGLLVLLLVLGLVGATVVFAFPAIVDQVLPGVISAPQSTAVPLTFIQEPFASEDMVVVVPAGRDVREAFIEAFTQKAREARGADVRVNLNVPPTYLGGDPVKIGEDSNGVTYRGSMTGYILVPKS